MGSRRKLTAGTVVMAGVLGLSSVAYACTVWVGQFEVSNDGSDPLTTKGDGPYETVTTYGLGIGMQHCWMEGAVRVNVDSGATTLNVLNLKYGIISPPTNPLDPGFGANAACPAAIRRSPAPNKPYTLSYLNTGFGDFVGGNTLGGVWTANPPLSNNYTDTGWPVDERLQRVYVRDCMAVGGAAATWDDPTPIMTDATGAFNVNRTVTPKPSGNGVPDVPGTESAICIQQEAGSYVGAPDGAQAPIIVV